MSLRGNRVLIFVSLLVSIVSITSLISQPIIDRRNKANERPSSQTIASQYVSTPLLDLVNAERAKAGLSLLQPRTELDKSSRLKLEHMNANNYWDHHAPDGTAYSDFIWDEMPYASMVGENLAKCFNNNTDTMTAWMNSPGHRANILGDFTYFGSYTAEGKDGCFYSVTHFARQ